MRITLLPLPHIHMRLQRHVSVNLHSNSKYLNMCCKNMHHVEKNIHFALHPSGTLTVKRHGLGRKGQDDYSLGSNLTLNADLIIDEFRINYRV